MELKIGFLLVHALTFIHASGICKIQIGYARTYWYDDNRDQRDVIVINCYQVHLNPFDPELDSRWENFDFHKLTIVDSNISIIPSSAFVNLPLRVVELRLNSTYITQIMPGAFNSLNYLALLNLSDNNLTKISDGVFNSLMKLRVLDLSTNKIQNISVHSFAGMGQLHTINLSHNPLKTFNNDFTHTANLKSLDLSFSQLSMLNFNLTSDTLNYLNLSNNYLSNFSGSFTHLTSLDLSKNALSSFIIDSSHTSATVLYINLSSNSLSEIRSENIRVNSTIYLFLENNDIASLPNGFFTDLNILSLNVSSNRLDYLQYGLFDSLHNLEVLDISHNKLNSFNRFNYYSLTNLRELYLHDNELSNLESRDILNSLPLLNRISLDGNNFTCEDLVEIFRHIKIKTVVRGHYFNSSNIYGIACSEAEDLYSDSTPLENSTNAGNLLLSKLNQFFNSGFAKSGMYKYFNGDFKNSNFFKYLDKLKDGSDFKNGDLYKYFHDDFKNSEFFKYMENVKAEMKSNDQYIQRVRNYFESDFKNTSFVKYLDGLQKSLNSMTDSFSKSSMYNYLNSGFTNSNFYKYLEGMKAPQFFVNYSGNHSDIKAEKLISAIPVEKNDFLYAPVIIMLLLLVCIASFMGFLTYLNYSKIIKRNKIQNEQVELIEA